MFAASIFTFNAEPSEVSDAARAALNVSFVIDESETVKSDTQLSTTMLFDEK